MDTLTPVAQGYERYIGITRLPRDVAQRLDPMVVADHAWSCLWALTSELEAEDSWP